MSVRSPGTSRDAQAAATRAHIVATALRLFGRHGYTATTTRRIAEAAGVSEGALFHHFPTKLDLVKAIPDLRSTFIVDLERALAQSGDQPVAVVMGRVTDMFTSLISDERDYVNLVIFGSADNPELEQLFREFLARPTRALSGYVEARQQAGELRSRLAPDEAASVFLGSLLIFLLSNRHLSAAQLRRRSRSYTGTAVDIWVSGTMAP